MAHRTRDAQESRRQVAMPRCRVHKRRNDSWKRHMQAAYGSSLRRDLVPFLRCPRCRKDAALPNCRIDYDVTPDGQWFIVNNSTQDPNAALTLVLSWDAG